MREGDGARRPRSAGTARPVAHRHEVVAPGAGPGDGTSRLESMPDSKGAGIRPSGAVITATKLKVPRGRRALVRRDRLVAAITAAAEAKLTLVIAPAGSGKTTLLGEWRSSRDEPRDFAWLSLDPGDNDPVKLFEGMIAALRTVEQGLGEQALASLAGPTSLTGVVLPSLINDLVARSRPLVLVLDDYHLVVNPSIHEAIAFLLEHLPETLQLALATRSAASDWPSAGAARARRGARRRPALHRRRGDGPPQRRPRLRAGPR